MMCGDQTQVTVGQSTIAAQREDRADRTGAGKNVAELALEARIGF